jgi:hypothetical protein
MPDIDPGVAFAGVRGGGILDDGLLSPFDIDKDIGVLVSTCAVLVDKQISCDGGATWVDQGLVLANEGGSLGCTTTDGTPIMVRYQVNNAGQVPLHACVLTETNTAFGAPGSVPTPLAPGATTAFIPAPQTPLCSDSLENNEPDTASVSCFCRADLNPDDKVSASDSADLTCQSRPELSVQKVCVDQNNDGIGEITVTVAASAADLDLVNCRATDNLFRDDPTCPADQGAATPVPLNPPNPFDVPAGGQVQLTGLTPAPPLTANACNTVSVTCTIESTGETLTDSADAVCPGAGKGCLTRTPGFWGNHPHITDDFLRPPAVVPLTVCGVELTTVEAGSGTSATEAICSVGRDGQILGPQLTQLVRQCTAALLNVAASASGGGNCLADLPPLTSLLNGCCGAASVCTGDPVGGITIQSCIDQLDAFNNSPDTLPPFGPFVSPGPADSSECRDARNNGVVVRPAP